MTKTVILVDDDIIKYSVASVGQRNWINITSETCPDVTKWSEFENITSFWGRKKAPSEWVEWVYKLLDIPKEYQKPKEWFSVEKCSEVSEPLENILHSAKLKIEGAINGVKAAVGEGEFTVEHVMGEGDSFRLGLSTLKKYKGERPPEKPLMFDDVVSYLKGKYKPTIAKDIEADDWLVMRSMELEEAGYNVVVVCIDKDMYTSPIQVFNPDRPEEGIVDCRGLGKLWLDGGKVRGTGRLFKYFQIISEDSIDNYKANCFSTVKWGAKSAYKVLVDCKDDKEAWQVMWDTFKMLYPNPIKVDGWKGEELEIDALYVFQEMVNMAHLHRHKDDFIDVKKVMDSMGIKYDNT